MAPRAPLEDEDLADGERFPTSSSQRGRKPSGTDFGTAKSESKKNV